MLFGVIRFGDIDPAAFVLAIMTTLLALIALWVALKESRRNNSVILKVRLCEGSSTQRVEPGPGGQRKLGQTVHEFQIWIQNRGVSLYNVAAQIGFQGKGNSGWLTFPLKSGYREPMKPGIVGFPVTFVVTSKYHLACPEYPEFARGMVASFHLRSNDLEPGAETFFPMLENPSRQQATLNIYAQNFLAYSFRIGGFRERAREKWNRFASWFNNLFKHSVGMSPPPSPPGSRMMHTPEILRKFVMVESHLMYFICNVLRNAETSHKAEPVDQSPRE